MAGSQVRSPCSRAVTVWRGPMGDLSGLQAWSSGGGCVLDPRPGKPSLPHPPLPTRNLSTFCTPARELKVKAILSFAPAFLFLCWFLRNQLPGLPAAAWTSSLTEEPPHPGRCHTNLGNRAGGLCRRGPPPRERGGHALSPQTFIRASKVLGVGEAGESVWPRVRRRA